MIDAAFGHYDRACAELIDENDLASVILTLKNALSHAETPS